MPARPWSVWACVAMVVVASVVTGLQSAFFAIVGLAVSVPIDPGEGTIGQSLLWLGLSGALIHGCAGALAPAVARARRNAVPGLPARVGYWSLAMLVFAEALAAWALSLEGVTPFSIAGPVLVVAAGVLAALHFPPTARSGSDGPDRSGAATSAPRMPLVVGLLLIAATCAGVVALSVTSFFTE